MKTFVYIDGFNLYNRALIHSQYKWLDLHKLCQSVLQPANEILAIKYYTARVGGRRDPDQPNRQGAYLRALRSLPTVSIHLGNFLEKEITRPLVNPISGLPRFVNALTTEEKGSDVNLASHLVWDGARNAYDVAVVLSKDTDLVEPLRIVRFEMGKVAGLICPDDSCPAKLSGIASFVRHLSTKSLASSQFPPIVDLPNGTQVRRPAVW